MAKFHDFEDFAESAPPSQQALLRLLRETVLGADPQLREKILYNTPFFLRKSWVCYVGKIHKQKGIEMCFPRGRELSNAHGLLETKGRAAIQGIQFRDVADFYTKEAAFLETLQEAILLDELSQRSAAADILNPQDKITK